MLSCSNRNDIDYIVSVEWDKCEDSKNCIIDFACLMGFEWDAMCFYSGGNSLEDINEDLGFELKEYTDTGDIVIFLNKGKVVYQKTWFYNPSKPPKGVIFITDLKKIRVNKSEAKFEIKKVNKAFYLEKI